MQFTFVLYADASNFTIVHFVFFIIFYGRIIQKEYFFNLSYSHD